MNKLKEGCLYKRINGPGWSTTNPNDLDNVSMVKEHDIVMVLSRSNYSWIKVLHKGKVCYIIGDKISLDNRYELIEEQA